MISITRYGPQAVLVRHSDRVTESALERGLALDAILESKAIAGCVERVPGFTTLLLRFHGAAPASLEALREHLAVEGGAPASSPKGSRLIRIPVTYGGSDLQRVADHAGARPEEVMEWHRDPTYRVHCLGFAPGFPYLGGLDPRLHTPRLSTPRTLVPAGSVAIGGEHTGIYSVASPGGWNVIGRTPSLLFNPAGESLDDLFLFRTGDRVRFEPESECRSDARALDPGLEPGTIPFLRIAAIGMGVTLQDAGRPGNARFGVPPAGCMDPELAAVANHLVENPSGTPVLELGLQGQRFEVLCDGWLAIGGARGELPGKSGNAFRVRSGETLRFPPAPTGVWRYLAVPGGWAGRRLLGSVSGGTRLGSGFALGVGDVLRVSATATAQIPDSVARRTWAIPAGSVEMAKPFRVWRGPQWDDFPSEALDQFFAAVWTVSSQCDRTGYRLKGDPLPGPPEPGISEPVLSGSIQVPPDGQPIVTMPDGPTLGGYPKMGWIDAGDRARLSQCRSGQAVQFTPAE